MAHQLQLENKKYRQWVKAVLGFRYLADGLAPFCNDLAIKQHQHIRDSIQQSKSIPPTVTCGTCQVETLKPDHKKVMNAGKRECPLGQVKCSCFFPKDKNAACPENICGAIYDYIIKNCASTPPAPNWKNTNAQQWSVHPWSICKCFIDAPGYKEKPSAYDTDCAGLIHVILNNIYFHSHFGCNFTGSNIFTKVRKCRNEIFHSSCTELEENDANSYIDDMIAILKDSKELENRPESQQAITMLENLKQKDFIITTDCLEKILQQIKEEMAKDRKSTNEEYEELKKKLTDIERLLCKEREGKLEVEKELGDLKKKVSDLETVVSEQKEKIKKITKENSTNQSQSDLEKAKLEFKKQLIEKYRKTLLQVSTTPLLPRGQKCSFREIYVRPTITSEIKGDQGVIKEIEISSMSEIFIKNGVPLKSIYVVGDAGSGKSSFCKYLINCWCMAHSDEQHVDDRFNDIEPMKKFDFMFFISLRHNQDIDIVRDMLKSQYDNELLSKVLEKDSAKIMILLDGLDEWSTERKTCDQFQTIGLPQQDLSKDYTIVTTSRRWKIHNLGIGYSEIEQLLNLKGFDVDSEKFMVKNTVLQLNARRRDCKEASACEKRLREKSLVTLKQIPIMLQQLICLWFDGKLDKTSRCAIYASMLELFFTWNELKTTGTCTESKKDSQEVKLPQYLTAKNKCKINSHLIYDVSQLAYETLFNCPKVKSLTYDISVFNELNISDEVRERCMKLGILTEDECPSLSVSEPPGLLFSFIHKSMQEFLAAVNIAIKFITEEGSPESRENVKLDRCSQFVKDVFQKCSTVNNILEQSNVIIMLCGLEPRLATDVSKYIYDIVSNDQKEYRTINSDLSCISNIQKLIVESIEECNASVTENRPVFYIGNLVITSNNEIVCSSIDQKQIAPDYVRSISVYDINTRIFLFSERLSKFQRLHRIDIKYDQGLSSTQSNKQVNDKVNDSVAGTIKVNASTLKSLSLDGNFLSERMKPVCKTTISCLPSVTNLVALRMRYITMSHIDTIAFCNFLAGNSHLEEIHLEKIKCECSEHHDVDLSKHKQLRYLHVAAGIDVTYANTTSLEVFRFETLDNGNHEKVFDIIRKSNKLKELMLSVGVSNNSQLYSPNVTGRLASVLSLLHNLSKLELSRFNLTDNLIKFPFEMKSLKHIELFMVKMSLTTWRKFVDRLPDIPHTVNVIVSYCCITSEGEECNIDMSTLEPKEFRGGRESDAMQHVKDKGQSFVVKNDDLNLFLFSTNN
ncbi:uncharacterized protein LOC132728569 [Ruditapes philippinarum]|uniref:uncharacterized protein LOC132728569 n=1 Tax=Ruditapes philippinarum TaxID=129788 RepID=UPI00295B94F1|nr:uncharacterized protein LOC132728569 [Ruditapes philippinarum]